jgi:hypothetical protein
MRNLILFHCKSGGEFEGNGRNKVFLGNVGPQVTGYRAQVIVTPLRIKK